MKCSRCGNEQEDGNFCSQCGTTLRGDCPSCDAPLVDGARYCTQCGAGVAPEAASGAGRFAWYGGAALLGVVLAVVFLVPRDGGDARAPAPGPGAAGQGAGGAAAPFTSPAGPGQGAPGPGLLSDDMRTNADRLFNRVMAAAGRGDEGEVTRFMPMAVQAYDMVEDLDGDGVYHLALLYLAGGRHAEARTSAARLLDEEPGHVLALGVSAEAAAAAGDDATARDLYRRLLDAYDEEADRPLREYREHPQMLDEYRAAARAYLED